MRDRQATTEKETYGGPPMDMPCNTVGHNLVLTVADLRTCIVSEKPRTFHLKCKFQINITGSVHFIEVSPCKEHSVWSTPAEEIIVCPGFNFSIHNMAWRVSLFLVEDSQNQQLNTSFKERKQIDSSAHHILAWWEKSCFLSFALPCIYLSLFLFSFL